jgi:hypothetical protein
MLKRRCRRDDIEKTTMKGFLHGISVYTACTPLVGEFRRHRGAAAKRLCGPRECSSTKESVDMRAGAARCTWEGFP